MCVLIFLYTYIRTAVDMIRCLIQLLIPSTEYLASARDSPALYHSLVGRVWCEM